MEERFWYRHIINTAPTGEAKVVSISLEWREGKKCEAKCTAPGQFEVLLTYPDPGRAISRLKEKGWL